MSETEAPTETKAPRKRRPKQKPVPGTERPHIPEITDTAEEYADVRDQRMAYGEEEVELRNKLVGLLEKHDLEEYFDEDAGISVRKDVPSVKVKVKRLKDQGGD